jgi:hypothetical protein
MAEAKSQVADMDRAYYSQRIGRGPLPDPTIEDVAHALTLAVDEMDRLEYLQEWHGYYCEGDGDIAGRAGMPLADHIEVETGWSSAWPLPDGGADLPADVLAALSRQRLTDQNGTVSYALRLYHPGATMSEGGLAALQRSADDKLFDLIEYFHRHVSQGNDRYANSSCSYSYCYRPHYEDFDPVPAQGLFRQRMNRALMNYRGGLRLSESGRVERTADEGLDQLIDIVLPTKDPDIARRVASAIALYRNRGRTEEDLRLAVRELFDVLEKLRPELKEEMLKGDEGALFHIANGFSIRHFNEQQKGKYDSSIWHQWMFYVNLSTIHVITHLVNRKAR